MRWLVVIALVGCAHHVRQDAHSGPDGRIAGANELRLDDRVEVRGIVTYPGGDRVDWYAVRLAKPGQVRIDLRWRSPRPGLQLGFDVFDAYHERLGIGSRRGPTHRSTGAFASDLVYVRVYARGRGDAGKYRLTLRREDVRVIVDDWHPLEIPDPPVLAAVPDQEPVCTDDNFDMRRPECRTYCPMRDPPPCWAACLDGYCPSPPPKRAPPPPPAPIVARVIAADADGDALLVRAAAGSDQGVQKDWHAWVVREGKRLPGGDATIVRVDKLTTVVKVRLTRDQVQAAPYLELSPP